MGQTPLSNSEQIYASTVRAVALSSSDELMKAARKVAPDPTVFEENPPVFWRAVISNNSLDVYSTRMAESTLKNYAKDAKRGVSFQNSHRTDDVGIGYSFGGEYDAAKKETSADFYTVQGLPETESFVRKMRAGIVRDVSVGFYGGTWVCSICGGDMMDYRECFHMAGVKYEVEGGGRRTPEIATATIEDAHLAEVSGVYDGATTGAEIIALMKAEQEISEGRLKPQTVRMLEERYRIKLPKPRVQITGTGEGTMSTQRETETTKPEGEEEEAAEVEQPAPAEPVAPEEAEEVRALLSSFDYGEEVKGLPAQTRRLLALARDGQAYRKDLVAEALAEGVRALGREFKKDTYEKMFRSADVETVRLMRDDWKRTADKNLQGGRQTVDAPEEKKAERISHVPDAAFAA